jgi:hypothetical protein
MITGPEAKMLSEWLAMSKEKLPLTHFQGANVHAIISGSITQVTSQER